MQPADIPHSWGTLLRSIALGTFALLAVRGASAECNVIPAANDAYQALVGQVGEPFATPGDPVVLRQGSRGCPGLAGVPLFSEPGGATPAPAGFVVTTVIETGDATVGSVRAYAVITVPGSCSQFLSAHLQDVQACDTTLRQSSGGAVLGCQEAGEEMRFVEDDGRGPRLRFPFPDTSRYNAAGLDLAGNARLIVTRADSPLRCNAMVEGCSGADARNSVVCVDRLFELGTCNPAQRQPHPVFASFTALPPRNDFGALCTGGPATGCANPGGVGQPPLRLAIDRAGNALIPWDFRGIEKRYQGIPIARIGRVLVKDFPSFGGPDSGSRFFQTPRIPSEDFVSAHAPNGPRVPPIFTPIPASPSPTEPPDALVLVGSVDAPMGVTRIARRSPTGRECWSGEPPVALDLPCTRDSDCGASGATCAPARCLTDSFVETGGRCTSPAEVLACGARGGACGPDLFNLRRGGAHVRAGSLVRTAPFDDSLQGTPLPSSIPITATQYALAAGPPVPIDGLIQTPDQLNFVVNEKIDADQGGTSFNRDSDTDDFVVTRLDRTTGKVEGLRDTGTSGRAVSRIQVSRFSYPAVAAEGRHLALLESEPTEGAAPGATTCADPALCACSSGGGCDANSDRDRVDSIVRLFSLPRSQAAGPAATDLLEAHRLIAIPVPFLDNAAILLRNGLLYFLGYEGLGTRYYVRKVSVRSDGTSPVSFSLGEGSSLPSLSATGRHVAFHSDAADLVPGDTNQTFDAFVRDRDVAGSGSLDAPGNAVTERVSVTSAGVQADPGAWPADLRLNGSPYPWPCRYGSALPSVSGDGRYVGFGSWSNNLTSDDVSDGDGGADAFVRDRCLSDGRPVPGCSVSTRRASLRSNGLPGTPLRCPLYAPELAPAPIAVPGLGSVQVRSLVAELGVTNEMISRDGRFALFESYHSNLDPAGPIDDNGRCPPLLIAFQPPVLTSSGVGSYFCDGIVGGYAFLAAGRDVFVRDMNTGKTELVSVGPSTPQAPLGTVGGESSFLTATPSPGQIRGPLISDLEDGRFVVFDSLATFAPSDRQGGCVDRVSQLPRSCVDVYLRDRKTKRTFHVSRPLPGHPVDGDSVVNSISRSGRVIAFTSASTSLVEKDTNGKLDVFTFDFSASPEDPSQGIIRRESVPLSRLLAERSGATSALTNLPEGDGDSSGGLLSFDGSALQFVTRATNLVVSDDVEGSFDFLLKGRQNGALARISTGNLSRGGSGLHGNWKLTMTAFSDCDPAFSTCLPDSPPSPESVFVSGIDMTDPFNVAQDRNGDGDISDPILFVVDVEHTDTNGAPSPIVKALSASVTASAAPAGGIVFLRPESDFGDAPALRPLGGDFFRNYGDEDLNDDGDTTDQVVFLYEGRDATGDLAAEPENLGLAANGASVSDEYIVALYQEGTGLAELPGGRMFILPRLGQPGSTRDWVETDFIADVVRVIGAKVAFTTPERLLPTGGCANDGDLNCDGDHADRFVHLYDIASGTLEPALESPSQEAGEFVFNGEVLAFRSPDAAYCGTAADAAWTGCGYGKAPPSDDCTVGRLKVLNVATSSLVDTHRAVTTCDLETCNPSFPYRVSGTSVRFITDELAQGCDLDGDLPDAPSTPPGHKQFRCERLVQTVDVARPGVLFDDPCSPGVVAAGQPVRSGVQLLSAIARPLGPGAVAGQELRFAGISVDPLADPLHPRGGDAEVADQALAAGLPEELRNSAAAPVILRPGICVSTSDGRRGPACESDDGCPVGYACDPDQLAKVGVSDSDADTVPDALDICPRIPDPDQLDRDLDGTGDACDRTVCSDLDSDGDGVGNPCDNCTNAANSNQRDTNDDGYGNLCDSDLNGDGIVNFSDLVRFKAAFLGTNPDADFDGNGVVNFSDLARMKTQFLKSPGPSGLTPESL